MDIIEVQRNNGVKIVVDVPAGITKDSFAPLVSRVVSTALDKCPTLKQSSLDVAICTTVQDERSSDGKPRPVGARGSFRTSPDLSVESLTIDVSEDALNTAAIVSPATMSHITYLGFILHEIFEVDWHVSRKKNSEPLNHALIDDPNYNQAEHEIVANKMALQHLNETMGFNGYGIDRGAFVIVRRLYKNIGFL